MGTQRLKGARLVAQEVKSQPAPSFENPSARSDADLTRWAGCPNARAAPTTAHSVCHHHWSASLLPVQASHSCERDLFATYEERDPEHGDYDVVSDTTLLTTITALNAPVAKK